MSEQVKGVVKWFDDTKGFGFIALEQGGDVFVHYKSIHGTGRKTLAEGQRVSLTVMKAEKGPQAQDVEII